MEEEAGKASDWLAKTFFEAIERESASRVEQAVQQDLAILEDGKEPLAPFYQALLDEIRAAGLPTDEASLVKLARAKGIKGWWWAMRLKGKRSTELIDAITRDTEAIARIEAAYLPVILKSIAGTGINSEHLMPVVGKHTGVPAQTFSIVGFIGAGLGGA